MLKRILVALDGSENAEKSIPWIKKYAGRSKAQVVLFRAVPIEHLEPEWIPKQVEEAREYVNGIEREINYAGMPSKTLVRTGKPAEAIVKAAAEEKADLILMTTRGGSPVERWLIGGVTEQVMRLSPVPVLVVQSRMEAKHQARVRRIVIPVDGSKLAETVIPWARRLAQFFKATLVFLHAYPANTTKPQEEILDGLRKRMGRLCELLAQDGIKAVFKAREGDPAERVLAHANRNDLILMTTHGYGGFKRWIFGSVAEKMIHGAAIPVVVYKTPEQVAGKIHVAAS